MGMGCPPSIGLCRGSLANESIKETHQLEFLVILWALQRFQPRLSGKTVQIFCDYTTAISYMNKQWGTLSRSPCRLTLTLWDFCALHNITPIATHLPGEQSVVVDALSRGTHSLHQLHLDPSALLPIFC